MKSLSRSERSTVSIPPASASYRPMSTVVSPPSRQQRDAATVATNVRRMMARDGLTFQDVVEVTGLDERTLRGLVRGANNPHARTLHKLAYGLGVPVDELFQACGMSPQQ